MNSLSEFWSKVIFPICGVEIISRDDSNIESGLPTSAATAMAHISVYCADQMKVQYEMKEQEMNSNVLLVNIGDKVVEVMFSLKSLPTYNPLVNFRFHKPLKLSPVWRLNIMESFPIIQVCVTPSPRKTI